MANWYDSVPAPVDANGRKVPLDTRELMLDGKVFEVGGLAYRNVECAWVADLVGFASKIPLDYCALPDSWERLEWDAGKDTCKYFNQTCSASCSACPAKSDETDPRICFNVMARDLVRRAKALAGVSDGE